jgi:transcriptional regulator with XRE-family HTH domain
MGGVVSQISIVHEEMAPSTRQFDHRFCFNTWTMTVSKLPKTMSRRTGIALRPYLVPVVRPSDLARRADVSRQYVSAVLLGQRPPSERILKAAAELGLPVHLIFPAGNGPTQSESPANRAHRFSRRNF